MYVIVRNFWRKQSLSAWSSKRPAPPDLAQLGRWSHQPLTEPCRQFVKHPIWPVPERFHCATERSGPSKSALQWLCFRIWMLCCVSGTTTCGWRGGWGGQTCQKTANMTAGKFWTQRHRSRVMVLSSLPPLTWTGTHFLPCSDGLVSCPNYTCWPLSTLSFYWKC